MFGSSGYEARPLGSVIASYVQCSGPQERVNYHVKSIVRLKLVKKISVHGRHADDIVLIVRLLSDLDRNVHGASDLVTSHTGIANEERMCACERDLHVRARRSDTKRLFADAQTSANFI